MTVARILAQKGRNVFCVSQEMTLLKLACNLLEKKIGAAVVGNTSGPAEGIISERDLVRAIAQCGETACRRTVVEFMTPDVQCCTLSDSVAKIMEIMTNRHFRHMPVLEDAVLIGIVSIGDVVRYRIGEIEQEADSMRDYISTSLS